MSNYYQITKTPQGGFSLLEVLVLVAILSMVFAFVFQIQIRGKTVNRALAAKQSYQSAQVRLTNEIKHEIHQRIMAGNCLTTDGLFGKSKWLSLSQDIKVARNSGTVSQYQSSCQEPFVPKNASDAADNMFAFCVKIKSDKI